MLEPSPGRTPELSLTGRDDLAVVREDCGDQAAARGDHTEALSCWGEALAVRQDRAQDSHCARLAVKMAAVEEASGREADACALYEQAAEAHTRAGEAESVPMCLNNLAMLRKNAGELEEACGLLRRALAGCVRCHGENHHETALIASNLGVVLVESGDLLSAVQAHMQALHTREILYGPSHPEVGLSLGHLAAVYQLEGDEDRARRHYESSLAILGEFPGLHTAEREVLQGNLDDLNSPAEEE